MNKKKFLKFLKIFFIILVSIFVMWVIYHTFVPDFELNVPPNPGPIQKIRMSRCEQASDCVQVNAGCCGCGSGGTATSVNKNYQEEWENSIESCVCPAVMSQHWTCVNSKIDCVSYQCKLVKIDETLPDDSLYSE